MSPYAERLTALITGVQRQSNFQAGLVAAEGFGVGLGHLAGQAHEEGQRRQAENDDGQDEEGVFVAEHRGLAEHLLIGLPDSHLRGVGGRYSVGHHHLFHAVHVEAVGNAAGDGVGGEIGLVDLRATGEVRREQGRSGTAAEVAGEVGEFEEIWFILLEGTPT